MPRKRRSTRSRRRSTSTASTPAAIRATSSGSRRWSSVRRASRSGTGLISRRRYRSIRGARPTSTRSRARRATSTSCPSAGTASPAAAAKTPISAITDSDALRAQSDYQRRTHRVDRLHRARRAGGAPARGKPRLYGAADPQPARLGLHGRARRALSGVALHPGAAGPAERRAATGRSRRYAGAEGKARRVASPARTAGGADAAGAAFLCGARAVAGGVFAALRLDGARLREDERSGPGAYALRRVREPARSDPQARGQRLDLSAHPDRRRRPGEHVPAVLRGAALRQDL